MPMLKGILMVYEPLGHNLDHKAGIWTKKQGSSLELDP